MLKITAMSHLKKELKDILKELNEISCQTLYAEGYKAGKIESIKDILKLIV